MSSSPRRYSKASWPPCSPTRRPSNSSDASAPIVCRSSCSGGGAEGGGGDVAAESCGTEQSRIRLTRAKHRERSMPQIIHAAYSPEIGGGPPPGSSGIKPPPPESPGSLGKRSLSEGGA